MSETSLLMRYAYRISDVISVQFTPCVRRNLTFALVHETHSSQMPLFASSFSSLVYLRLVSSILKGVSYTISGSGGEVPSPSYSFPIFSSSSEPFSTFFPTLDIRWHKKLPYFSSLLTLHFSPFSSYRIGRRMSTELEIRRKEKETMIGFASLRKGTIGSIPSIRIHYQWMRGIIRNGRHIKTFREADLRVVITGAKVDNIVHVSIHSMGIFGRESYFPWFTFLGRKEKKSLGKKRWVYTAALVLLPFLLSQPFSRFHSLNFLWPFPFHISVLVLKWW